MAITANPDRTVEATQSFLSFRLGEELFAIHVKKIMEILEVPKITHVPHAPPFLKGVINLRGSVLPVIDTRLKFGIIPESFTINTSILVLNVSLDDEEVMIGALVDSVFEVFETEKSHIQPSPSIGARYKSGFIQGMLKEGDKFMMLLDIDAVFSTDDLETLIETKESVSADTSEDAPDEHNKEPDN
jgi:purine-binding chemotaxis protein CheW